MKRYTDKDGRDYAVISEIDEGDVLQTDGDFTCVNKGTIVTVKRDCDGSLYFKCSEGRHGLDGQAAEHEGCADFYIGLYRLSN